MLAGSIPNYLQIDFKGQYLSEITLPPPVEYSSS